MSAAGKRPAAKPRTAAKTAETPSRRKAASAAARTARGAGPARQRGEKNGKGRQPPARKTSGIRAPVRPAKKPSAPRRPATDPQWVPLGEITHYFSKITVCVVHLHAGSLKIGDRVQIKGKTTFFSQPVTSLQVESLEVRSARKGQLVGMMVRKPVRVGDLVLVERARRP